MRHPKIIFPGGTSALDVQKEESLGHKDSEKEVINFVFGQNRHLEEVAPASKAMANVGGGCTVSIISDGGNSGIRRRKLDMSHFRVRVWSWVVTALA